MTEQTRELIKLNYMSIYQGIKNIYKNIVQPKRDSQTITQILTRPQHNTGLQVGLQKGLQHEGQTSFQAMHISVFQDIESKSNDKGTSKPLSQVNAQH